ncbi:uncharacterized protein LOC111405253 [Olea europaea var. sylvestris]|uniref:Uncharacterized protein LOC111405253 n=1 Tax=Olea europaea subsp. europaea TaxID=158383 RepID=A0A8S0QXD6_OLEEU|nr:uncharacterized protein LOC111405253 [Olea europaea var. sylvestris]CAA2970697.1 uncharacterized protein LOC111405253 [Olea europaea subsp. europaea]
MSLTGNRLLCKTPTRTTYAQLPLRRPFLVPSSPSWSYHPRTSFTVSANPKKLSSSSKTGRFDSKNRRSSVSTKEQEEEVVEKQRMDEISVNNNSGTIGAVDDGFVMPELPGEKPDFWEGPQWDVFGFVLQYLWAFGIVFALIACGIAVATYNEGATDFKDTPVYKESIQSRDLLDEPDASNSDVFESNPTEQAPSLD